MSTEQPSFRTLMATLAPPWLSRKWGERFLYGFAVHLDAIAEWAMQGRDARYPEYAPDDALPYLFRDRQLRRGFAETSMAARTRLLGWIDAQKRRGTALALLEQLHGYWSPYSSGMRFSTVDNGGTWYVYDGATKELTVTPQTNRWDWDGAGASQWDRFWVVIHPLDSGAFTDAGQFGSDESFGAPGSWGLSSDPAIWGDVLSIVRDWKPEGTTCVYVVACLEPDELTPASLTFPNGDWANWAKLSGGVWVPSRPDFTRWIGRV